MLGRILLIGARGRDSIYMHKPMISFTHSGVRSPTELQYPVKLSACELPFLGIHQQNSWPCPQRVNYGIFDITYTPEVQASMGTAGFLWVCQSDRTTLQCCQVTALQEGALTTNWHWSSTNPLHPVLEKITSCLWIMRCTWNQACDSLLTISWRSCCNFLFCPFSKTWWTPCFVMKRASALMETRWQD